MRNFFLSLTFMVALLLPQSLWAQTATVVGTKLTINTNFAGQVYAAVGALNLTPEQKAAITEIELIGKFNENDLNAIKGDAEGNSDGDFTGVTKVDMTNAQFVNTSAKLYRAGYLPANASVGDNALVGGTLYQLSFDYNKKHWIECGEPASGSITLYSTEGAMTGAISSAVEGTYAKVPYTYQYCQLIESGANHWEFSGSGAPNQKPARPWTISPYNNNNYTENLNDEANEIEIVRYYIFTNDGGSYHWAESDKATWDACEKTKWTAGADPIYADPIETCLNNTVGNYNWDGFMFSIATYYRKVTGKTWSEPIATDPGSSVDGNFDVSDRESHKDSYSNGQWVKMYSTYKYFVAQADEGAYSWTVAEYSDGDSRPIDIRVANYEALETYKKAANIDKLALVGAQTMTYNGSEWVPGVTDVNYYSYMKFSYWSNTITTAITSKYADNNISNDIFQNCKQLTDIQFLAGTVKGLNDRKSPTYANFALTIGKDVTNIADAAVSQSRALISLTFDKDYSGGTSGYPKELIIGSQAFMDCFNLMKVEIPNRCTTIGNTAFKNVGNGADGENNFTNLDQEFKLTFERRHSADDSSVGINCDFELNIGGDAFMYCKYLKTLSLPIRLESLGDNCFKFCRQLNTLEMREETNSDYTPRGDHHLLRTIPSGAFHTSSLSVVKIPRCVTRIKKDAFGDTRNLTKVTFQDTDETDGDGNKKSLYIEEGAFSGGQETERPQLDIYLMTNPYDGGRYIFCEYQAFNFTQTVGQTSTDLDVASFATLHFPEQAWDYYQGNWKRGLAFRQGNLDAFKNGYQGSHGMLSGQTCVGKGEGSLNTEITNDHLNTGKYQKSGSDQNLVAPANGWQEFARTSTSIDIEIPTGSFLRSFSTKKPLAIPVYATGTYEDQPMFDIYRISAFDNSSVGKVTATQVVVHTYSTGGSSSEKLTDRYVPMNSGFLMVGRGDGGYLLYMKELTGDDYTNSVTFPFTAEGENPNLLYPTCLDEQFVRPSSWPAKAKTPTLVNDGAGVMLYPTIPHPYSPSKAPLQYRLFGLTKVAGHQGQFDRIAEETVVTRDKAYLRLTPEQFPLSNEGSYGGGDSGLGNNSGSAPIMLSFMDPEGNTTDVRMIDSQTMTIMEDCYYTLQGVKINGRPTQQGIYIHNGKKVVIK